MSRSSLGLFVLHGKASVVHSIIFVHRRNEISRSEGGHGCVNPVREI